MGQLDHPIADMTALANLVRAARLSQGMTRDDLAHATGLSPKFISHLESGKPTAQVGKVLALLRELGVTLHARPIIEITQDVAARAARRRRTAHRDDSTT